MNPIPCLRPSLHVLFGVLLAGCQTHAPQASTQPVFATPQAGFERMLAAFKQGNMAEAETILGVKTPEILSGDPVADTLDRRNFLKMAEQNIRIREVTETSAWVDCGADFWTFPVPIVRDGAAWRFDGAWGREEIRNRIIGRNEIATMETLRDLSRAQHAYLAMDADGDGVQAYAARILSQPGQRDGLYWPPAKHGPRSPIARMAAAAADEGYQVPSTGKVPYHGYYFRVLQAQGKHAQDGRASYTDATGKMTNGFAILAWPAEYGRSGVMSFMVNAHGLVYERDFGKATTRRAAKTKVFDPDKNWTLADTFAAQ